MGIREPECLGEEKMVMTKRGFFHLVMCAVLCVVLAGAARSAEILPIALGEWPPYVSQSLDGYGAAPEIVTQVFAAMGVSPAFAFYPWKRAEHMVKGGDVWASCPWFRTAGREKEYTFSSEPLFSASTLIFYHALNPALPKNIELLGIENLRNYRFGGVHGYYYEKFFINGGYSYFPTSSSEQAFKMLQSGRVDFVIEDSLVEKSIIDRKFHNNVYIIPLKRRFFVDNMYMIFPKKSKYDKKFICDFDENLKKFKKSSLYIEILNKYGIDKDEFMPSNCQIILP
jgi:polar amino acid transport system substrate-binding protein